MKQQQRAKPRSRGKLRQLGYHSQPFAKQFGCNVLSHEVGIGTSRMIKIVGEGVAPKATIGRDESRRCFAFRWRNVLNSEECRLAYGSLVEHAPWVEIKGAKGSTRRSTAWYTKGACSCSYTYSTVRIPGKHVRQMSAAFQQAMERLTALVFNRLFPQLPQEKWPNSANLDLYANEFPNVHPSSYFGS